MTVTPITTNILVVDHSGCWWLIDGDDWICDDYGNVTILKKKKAMAYFYAPLLVGPDDPNVISQATSDEEEET